METGLENWKTLDTNAAGKPYLQILLHTISTH